MLKKEKIREKKKIIEAAALQYSPESDSAPKIVAIGKGDSAENIIRVAKENNIPIHKDESISNILSALNIGDEIPRELYGVIAEMLIFISSIDKEYGEKYKI